jgi:hypothetical protein
MLATTQSPRDPDIIVAEITENLKGGECELSLGGVGDP